ncbi:MAG: hypothetical protein VB080_05250 [Propionicimonas sp.]|uniref:hypothetical protein n=1 Tax=Propionicimonas sp. TaxID=1955623 RepID=UPI002B20821C|nr:hypothetical protein [Propionicimonas sp.]MEA4943831.1 hypothetical protein [Propionicimonas sp.]
MIRQRVLDKAEFNRLDLSGSILDLPVEDALAMCDALVAHGGRVHIDVIDETYPRRIGVVDEVVRRIPRRLWDAVELHLMVGPDQPLDYPRFGRVVAHLRDPRDPGLAERLPLAGERWISLEPQLWQPEDVRTVVETVRPDGILIMLTPPADAPTAANLDRLLLPSAVEARSLRPIGVDGGARPEHFAHLAELGVSSVVVGRALFQTTKARATGAEQGGTSP